MTEVENEEVAAVDALRPFYFYVVAWGERFRGYLAELCLPSLLSPNNIPALTNRAGSRILICSPREDWEALRETPIFPLLTSHIEPVWIEMPFPRPDEPKMMVMSRGQKACLEMAFQDRAYGVVLAPDLVLSDGSVAELQRLALEDKKLVLSVALRFSMDPIVAAFRQRGLMRPGEALTLPPRELMQIALPHLHSEIRRFEWDAPYFADFPISCYWRVPDGSGIVVHSFSWAPMLLDFGSLAQHRAETLDTWTLDGDYVHQNFPDAHPTDDDVHVITDSDRLAFVSLTSESELTFYPLEGHWTKSLPLVGKWTKTYLLHKAYNNPVFDDLKRELFICPVKLHDGDLSKYWRRVEKYSMGIMGIIVSFVDLDYSAGCGLVSRTNDYGAGYYVINTWIPRKPIWDISIFLGKCVRYLRLSVNPHVLYLRICQWLALLFAYMRVIGLAVLGNRTEQARIRKRIALIRSEYGSLRRFALGPLLTPFSRASSYIMAIRSPRRGPSRQPAAPVGPGRQRRGTYVIRIPVEVVALIGGIPRRLWEIVICMPRLLWLRAAPYLRVISLAIRGDGAEQARIRRRIGIIVAQVGARLR